jgi:hypothetical protein
MHSLPINHARHRQPVATPVYGYVGRCQSDAGPIPYVVCVQAGADPCQGYGTGEGMGVRELPKDSAAPEMGAALAGYEERAELAENGHGVDRRTVELDHEVGVRAG